MWHILINGEKNRRCGNCNRKPLICAYLQMNLILKGIGIEKNAYLCTVVSEPPKPLSRATGKRVGTSGRGVCRQRQTYKKDVVTAFYLRRIGTSQLLMTTAIAQCTPSMVWRMVVLLCVFSVGFGIAYSVVKGNAKASIRGISKKVVPTLFYMLFERENKVLTLKQTTT